MAGSPARQEPELPVPLPRRDIPKARWAGAVRDVALLVAVGVNDQGYREVLAVEAAAGERTETYRGMLQGLGERGLRGVKLVISDDHEAIKSAVKVELPGVAWQRCTVHF